MLKRHNFHNLDLYINLIAKLLLLFHYILKRNSLQIMRIKNLTHILEVHSSNPVLRLAVLTVIFASLCTVIPAHLQIGHDHFLPMFYSLS